MTALIHKVEIQEVGHNISPSGGREETLTSVRQCRASVEPLKGSELLELGVANAEADWRVRCRYSENPQIDAAHVISWTHAGVTRELDIVHVANEGTQNRFWVVFAKERQA